MLSHEGLLQGIQEINSTDKDIRDTAIEFARLCSDYLGVGINDPLNQWHLRELTEKLDLAPVAFINVGNHWNLVVGKTDQGVEVYDPMDGLREERLKDINKIWYFPGNHRWQRVPQYFLVHSYELSREKLEELGIIQNGPGGCGQFCIFAAKYAKGK